MNPRRAITVWESVDVLEAQPGPLHEHFARIKPTGLEYRWALGSVLTPDGVTVLGHSGGEAGTYLLMRQPDEGVALDDADATILVGGGRVRRIPTLTGERTYTLGTTNAAAGDTILLRRPTASGRAGAVVNGGPDAGTLTTFPINAAAWALFYFDGTDWALRANALMF
jgi:hypothetical protein